MRQDKVRSASDGMVNNPYQVVRDFEEALCNYTGAKYAVTTNSCTNALLLACAYHKTIWPDVDWVNIPKHTYVSVPMSIRHAGFSPIFVNKEWSGTYQLEPFQIWDSARRFTSNMYLPGQFQCVSFHWAKILGIQQGGAILHNNSVADRWLRRARFDGRREGVHPSEDDIMMGWHCYMSPEIAAEGLVRISFLPTDNEDLPNDDYPDLSKMECFT